MNFTALKAELIARGFDYLSDTRLGQYINDARAELDDTELWPYRYATATATNGPVAIDDLGPVLSVSNVSGGAVVPIRAVSIGEHEATLTTTPYPTGTPQHYAVYDREIVIYPRGDGGTISVSYYKASAALTGTDTPLAPTRFHMLIVDMAVQRAYRDADNHEAAAALQGEIERRLGDMRNTLLLTNVDGPQDYIQARAGWDY